MIRAMDIVVDGTGHITLIVPGPVAAGALVLALHAGWVTLGVAGGEDFVRVEGVAEPVLDALAGQGHVGLIAAPDPGNPPISETHRATVRDLRAVKAV